MCGVFQSPLRACSTLQYLLHSSWWCICCATASPQAFPMSDCWTPSSCCCAALLILLCPAICRPGLVRDIVQCCRLARAPAAVDAALQCVIQMTASAALQVSLLFQAPALVVLLDTPASPTLLQAAAVGMSISSSRHSTTSAQSVQPVSVTFYCYICHSYVFLTLMCLLSAAARARASAGPQMNIC